MLRLDLDKLSYSTLAIASQCSTGNWKSADDEIVEKPSLGRHCHVPSWYTYRDNPALSRKLVQQYEDGVHTHKRIERLEKIG